MTTGTWLEEKKVSDFVNALKQNRYLIFAAARSQHRHTQHTHPTTHMPSKKQRAKAAKAEKATEASPRQAQLPPPLPHEPPQHGNQLGVRGPQLVPRGCGERHRHRPVLGGGGHGSPRCALAGGGWLPGRPPCQQQPGGRATKHRLSIINALAAAGSQQQQPGPGWQRVPCTSESEAALSITDPYSGQRDH
jgi:hypothetical protein